MRTRFLPSNDATGAKIQALDFVQLPLPHFPPTDSSSFLASFIHCLDEIPVFTYSPEIEDFPIDDALSIFLSDVLPHSISSDDPEESSRLGDSKEIFVHPPLEWSAEIYNGDKQVVRLVFEGIEIQDMDVESSNIESGNAIKILQFEIPDMDMSLPPLESAICSQNDSLHIFSQISDTESTTDMMSELTACNHLEIQQSLFSIDDMSMEYSMEKGGGFLGDDCSIQEELHYDNLKFPLFEVGEESMCIFGRVYMVDSPLNFSDIETEQLAQPNEVFSNNKELLSSDKFDLIKNLLHYSAAKKCLEEFNFSSHLDFLGILSLSDPQNCSVFHNEKHEDESITSIDSFFDEFLFVDLGPYKFSEVLLDAVTHHKVENCESMFGEAMNFKNLNELIVSHELTLLDQSFKSLPVPILSDQLHYNPLHVWVEGLLGKLDSQSSSASDSLYLDWHYLGENGCEITKYSSIWMMLWDIETFNVNASLFLCGSQKLLLDFILHDDYPVNQHKGNNKEMLNIPSNDVPVVHTSSGITDLTISSNHGDIKVVNGHFSKKMSNEKAPLFGESMSSDLDFFLNPNINVTDRDSMSAGKSDANTMLTTSDDSIVAKATTTVQQKWDMQVHQVKLSDNIILLIGYLQKHFLAFLENDKELIQMQNQYQAANDLNLLCTPNVKLMCRIKEISSSSTYVADNDDHIMVLAVLYTIKQMAFYLCFYGVQATFLYIDKLIRNLQCMKSRMSFLYKLIKDEHEKAEKELSIIHPSISILQEILRTNLCNRGSKILVVADQVFWWPLERLMNSLKISYNEPQRSIIHSSSPHHHSEIADSVMDVMLHSDCCLVSHDYVSASFPFNKFSFILEYGGSNESSNVSSISCKLDRFPTLYFVKVEVEEPFARALSDGANIPKSIDLEMKKDIDSTLVQRDGISKLEEILNAIPVKESNDNRHVKFVTEDENCYMVPDRFSTVCSDSKQNLPHRSYFPDTIIIVNTRSFYEEMVISRRSTYLRILEMEKQGSQVVERDISLPVDLIVSAEVSLTWYNSRNIGKKASALDEAFSCLPLCVESIAESILTSLSFAFSCCVLIFEGEGSFLSSIIESSDELYAAAASLGIEIQLFCSYSSEMTEEIILSCISIATKLSRGRYPKMSESESLAESFLTMFPAINPLSAHAILSSGDVLGKFLEFSNEGRNRALKTFQVPDESIALLNAMSRYGERDDSKSGMTDCSSSVSSVQDSRNIQSKSARERKKPRYTDNIFDAAEPSNHTKSLNLPPDGQLNLTKWSVSCNSWLSGNADISDKPGQFNSSFNDKLSNCEKFDAKGFETVEFDGKCFETVEFDPKGFEISAATLGKTWIPMIDVDCNPGRQSPAEAMNLSRKCMKAPYILQDNFKGEVIDVENTRAFKKKNSAAKSSCFSTFLLDVEEDCEVGNVSTSEMSLGPNNNMAFTNSASDAWISRGDTGQILREEIRPRFATIERNNYPRNCQSGFLEEDVMGKDSPSSCNLAFKHTHQSNSADTPLSNALHSTQTQQGSPWTIEFLNRIREKSRLRQQSVPRNLSSPTFGFPNNTSKITKRKSPSVFELYKYEGSTPRKIFDKKPLKRTSQPQNSVKNKKATASSVPQWTPVDKRARRALSFSSNDISGQSKLIWMDNNPHASQKRL